MPPQPNHLTSAFRSPPRGLSSNTAATSPLSTRSRGSGYAPTRAMLMPHARPAGLQNRTQSRSSAPLRVDRSLYGLARPDPHNIPRLPSKAPPLPTATEPHKKPPGFTEEPPIVSQSGPRARPEPPSVSFLTPRPSFQGPDFTEEPIVCPSPSISPAPRPPDTSTIAGSGTFSTSSRTRTNRGGWLAAGFHVPPDHPCNPGDPPGADEGALGSQSRPERQPDLRERLERRGLVALGLGHDGPRAVHEPAHADRLGRQIDDPQPRHADARVVGELLLQVPAPIARRQHLATQSGTRVISSALRRRLRHSLTTPAGHVRRDLRRPRQLNAGAGRNPQPPGPLSSRSNAPPMWRKRKPIARACRKSGRGCTKSCPSMISPFWLAGRAFKRATSSASEGKCVALLTPQTVARPPALQPFCMDRSNATSHS